MQERSVLGQVALGYSPMIDRRREVIATRLTVFPERPDLVPDAAALLAEIETVWPATDSAVPLELTLRPLDPTSVSRRPASAPPPVSLNIASEALLHGAMRRGAPAHLMMEIPAFMATDPTYAEPIRHLHADGTVLLIKGRPLQPLTPEILECFSHSLVEASDDRRTAGYTGSAPRRVSTVQIGVYTPAELEQSFERGAVAVLGWNIDDVPQPSGTRAAVPTDVRTVMELINGVERDEPVSRLEAVLKREPTVAFRLMRYLNSAAFGLQVEITSLGHALMLLGHNRLKRWLVVLLASSASGGLARATMFAAVRRGLLMEELARPREDNELKGEMFICGVFSLLDRLLRKPMPELFASVPVTERVRLALLGEGGPFQGYLELTRAIEQESLLDIREHADRLMLDLREVNVALLSALRKAREVD